jgi:hypothetical protein
MTNPSLALPTTLGVCNSQSIVAQTTPVSFMTTQAVTLNFNYVRSPPPGYPDPNPGVAVGTSKTSTPQTILSGQRITFFSDEAAALLLAGVASS